MWEKCINDVDLEQKDLEKYLGSTDVEKIKKIPFS